MKTETLISIFYKLNPYWDEPKTIESYFNYEFDGKKYQIHLDRDEGKIINFEIRYIGEITHENT